MTDTATADSPGAQPLGLPLNNQPDKEALTMPANDQLPPADAVPVDCLVGRLEPEREEFDDDWRDDDDPWNQPAATCQHCSGTGGDPWNDGITPCEHCDGEGYEWWK